MGPKDPDEVEKPSPQRGGGFRWRPLDASSNALTVPEGTSSEAFPFEGKVGPKDPDEVESPVSASSPASAPSTGERGK